MNENEIKTFLKYWTKSAWKNKSSNWRIGKKRDNKKTLLELKDMLNVSMGFTFAQLATCCQSTLNSQLFLDKGEFKMKNITKRKDGRYSIRKMIDGESVNLYARTLAEAKITLQKIKTGKIKVTKKERVKNYTLSEYTNFWLITYKKPFIAAKSYSAIKGFARRFLSVLGNYKIKDLTTENIQEYLNTLPRNRAKEKISIYLNSVLQKAVDTGVIIRNPFNAIIKDKKITFKNDAYTFAEQQKILEVVKGTDIEHEIMIYLMCGCRPNELPSKKSFDFLNNYINIYGTKNENAKHRVIEMSQAFADYIKAYFAHHDIQAEKYVSKKFNELCNKVEITKPLLYRLRHTFATNHFTLGTPPKYVQQWLGHSTISMTLDTYTDIDKTASKSKIEALYNNFYYTPIKSWHKIDTNFDTKNILKFKN